MGRSCAGDGLVAARRRFALATVDAEVCSPSVCACRKRLAFGGLLRAAGAIRRMTFETAGAWLSVWVIVRCPAQCRIGRGPGVLA